MAQPDLKLTLEWIRYYDSLFKQIKHSSSVVLGQSLRDGSLANQYQDSQKEINKYQVYIPDDKLPTCTSKHDMVLNSHNESPKDYMRINSKLDQLSQRRSREKLALSQQSLRPEVNRVVQEKINKNVLNDYLSLLSKRQEVIDSMQVNVEQFDNLHRERIEQVEKNFSKDSHFRHQIQKIGKHVANAKSIVASLISSNDKLLSRSHRKLDSAPLFNDQMNSPPQSSTTTKRLSTKRLNLSKLHKFQSIIQPDIQCDVNPLDNKRGKRSLILPAETEVLQQVSERNQQQQLSIPAMEQRQMNTSAKDRRKSKGLQEINNYMESLKDTEHLISTYRSQIKNKQYRQAMQLQKEMKDKSVKQQQHIKDLLLEQHKPQGHSNVDRLIQGHRDIISNSNTELPQQCKSRDELYTMLKEQCLTVGASNKRLVKRLDKQQRINQRGYGLLKQKFKVFQEQCEMGDDLEGLKLD